MLERQFVEEDDRLHSRLVMDKNIRSAVLDRAKNLRNNSGNDLRDLSFGRLMLNIPLLDYEHLKRTRRELFEGDKDSKAAAWAAFIKSPDSLPYRVR